MKSEPLLMLADSERDADLLYLTGLFVADPFIYYRVKGRAHVVMSDLEIDRARREARGCRVLSLRRCVAALQVEGRERPSLARVAAAQLKKHRIKRVFVPPGFAHSAARELREWGVKVRLKRGAFLPQRQWKTADEVKKISAALTMAEVGLAEGIQILRQARIGKGRKLLHHGVPLTADKLRGVIDTAVIQAGGIAQRTIVACGKQACDPHERGSGVLKANQPIVIDIFPRSQKTGYFGDITRTVVRGRAAEPIRRMHQVVVHAQELAFRQLTHGKAAAAVHESVRKFFEEQGYRTGRKNGRMQGFFHGTGHGLGLELHEAPRIGEASEEKLAAGHVVTVEPGLYYPELGGVRLEDVAWVTKNGARNLTKFEKALEI